MRSFADLIACSDAFSPGSVVGSIGALWSYLVLSLVSCADGGKLALWLTLEPEPKPFRFSARRWLRTPSF
jgi:hypothetical protein